MRQKGENEKRQPRLIHLRYFYMMGRTETERVRLLAVPKIKLVLKNAFLSNGLLHSSLGPAKKREENLLDPHFCSDLDEFGAGANYDSWLLLISKRLLFFFGLNHRP